MIKADAKLSIRRIPLECIQVKEYQERYVEKLLDYVEKLKSHPGEYAGLLFVVPSDTHPGMFALLDGHHKFCGYIMTGRKDALCVVIEEPKNVDVDVDPHRPLGMPSGKVTMVNAKGMIAEATLCNMGMRGERWQSKKKDS